MNFGIVNQWYPPETGGGGVATYNLTLAHELNSLGHQVVVVSSTHLARARLEYDGSIPVYRIPSPRISTGFDRHLPVFGAYMWTLRALLYASAVRHALPAIVARNNLDVLEYADSAAEAFFHDHRSLPPYGVRLHGTIFSIEPYYRGKEMPYNTKYFKLMEKKAILGADVITSPTRAYAEVIRAEYDLAPSRIQIVPHFFTADDCSWIQQHSLKPDPTILFVGRLEWKKGADIFAQAIPLVARNWPNARFVFLAWDRPQPDGSSTKAMLQDLFLHAGVMDKVRFLTAPEIPGCFYAALRPDICVVPSRYEAFSFPCLESMAHGVPVVASRVCGIPEVVDENITGLLFDVGDVPALAEALNRLIADSALRDQLGKAGLARATSAYFDPRLVTEQILSVYAKTLAFQSV